MKTGKIITTALVASAAAATVMALTSFRTLPKGAVPVKPFDLKKYLGKWYEIARLDYKWEKHMDNVTATYSLKDNGDIRVDNKGYDLKKEKWEESIGKAKPVADPEEARLKVSFFGPFYAGYNVIAIDPNYRYALVVGESTNYMWILSRETTIPDDVKQDYLKQAETLGFKTENLIWPKHDKDLPK